MVSEALALRVQTARCATRGEGGASRGGLSIYAQDNTRKNYNIIIDHSSFFWQQDDNAIWGPNYNITLQWNIFAEGVGNFVPGYENSGRKCLIVGQEGDQDQATNLSIHHNYLANCDQRNLRLASDGPAEFVNNVIYNWGSISSEPQQLNQVGNGGFEEGGGSWYLENASVVSGNAQSGASALSIGTGDGYVGQTVSAVAGASYTLKGWGRLSATGTNGTFGLRALNPSGASLGEWTVDFTTTTYTEKTITVTAPANTTQFLIYFYKPASTTYLYADTISLLRNNPPNLILNPGFESGSSSWSLYTCTSVVASNARSGSYAIVTTGGAGGADQTVALVGGATYRFLVWGKINSTSAYNDVTLYIRDASGANLQVLSLSFSEAGYTPKGFTFTAPPNATQMSITYWKGANSATIYLDDFSLTRE